MRVLVTGATGFLGKHVCKTLNHAGHMIWATSATNHPSQEGPTPSSSTHCYAMGDSLPADLTDWAPEIVVHLAWEGIPDFSAEMCEKNMNDQVRFLEQACVLPSVQKIVATGTCREYGNAQGPCSESYEVKPIEEFGYTKDALRRELENICAESDVGATWLRVFYAYGPGQRVDSLIPSLLLSLSHTEEAVLRSANAAHDFIHVEDVAVAVLCAVERAGTTGIFNVGSGHPTRVSDLAEIVRAVWSGESLTEEVIICSDGTEDHLGMWADLVRSKELLNWHPEIDLASGVEATVRWFTRKLS